MVDAEQRRDWLGTGLALLVFALTVRVAGAWALGEGAPFGPDGTGVEAAVHLGGHPFPLHIALLHLTGGVARSLSLASGALSCVLLWAWGRRIGLGGAGGWWAACLPITVLPGTLAAGDAPALLVVLLGAMLSLSGGAWALAGGAVAALSVAIKPIALPALVLLFARPISLGGALPVLVLLSGFTRPLWSPLPDGGLLGTWWVATSGRFPSDVASWATEGLVTLIRTPVWSTVWLLPVAAAVGIWRGPSRTIKWVAVLPLIVGWTIAAMFGGRLEQRYFSAAVWAALPFVGAAFALRPIAARLVGLPLLWPTAALMTQLGQYRAAHDVMAVVPGVPAVPFPIDVRPIFDSCSTEDATRMRQLAVQLAEVAPEGATIMTEARRDGREGELFWPLRVLRPDIKVQTQ